jgi:SAM-dependent methyltransferase
VDWGLGRYEQIAVELLPAASVVVDRAAPLRDERVVDVGCGTGNAALLAARRGASVTGVDPAGRLLDVAIARAAAHGLDATFVRGEAHALPLTDGVADVVLSVFGVIFAPDAAAAAAEIARVTAPGGRVVLCAWIPGGALAAVASARRDALAVAVGGATQAPMFAWHDEDALTGVFAPHGFSLTLEERSLAFTAASAKEFVEAEFRDHPAWVDARTVLGPRRAELQAVRDRALELFEAANEEAEGFRVTSRYIVAAMHR